MVSKTYKNTSAIPAGTQWVIDPQAHFSGTRDYMQKHVPFNSLFVSNEDAATIEVYPSGSIDRKQVIPQSGTRNLLTSDKTLDVFQYVIVKNVSLTEVAIGNVTVRIGREGR